MLSPSRSALLQSVALLVLLSCFQLFPDRVVGQQPPPVFEECGTFEPDPFGLGCILFISYANPGSEYTVNLGSSPTPPLGVDVLLTGIQVSCVGICFPTSCILDATYELSCSGAPPPPEFIRGDCNNDASFNIADVIFHLNGLFSSGAPPACQNACDFNSDLGIDVADAVIMLSTLFTSGPPPAAPWPDCGSDPWNPAFPDCLNPICP